MRDDRPVRSGHVHVVALGCMYELLRLRAAVVLAVILVALGCGAVARGHASAQTAKWKLVYEHYDERIGEGGTGIDVVTSVRKSPQSLVRRRRGSGDNYKWPVWSPDGRAIAFAAEIAGTSGLYAMSAGGGHLRRLADGHLFEYSWSPNGREIAFVAGCGLSDCRNGRIEVVGRDGGPRQVVVRPKDLSRSASVQLRDWSYRGDLLYLVRNRGRGVLYTASRTGSTPRVVADSRIEGRLEGATWSADGRLIAYKRRCWENRIGDSFCDLAVMTSDGRSKRVLRRWLPGPTGPSDDPPTWIPHSSRVAFVIWGGSDASVRMLDAHTSRETVISTTPWWILKAGGDGRTIGGLDSQGVVLAGLDGFVLARRDVPVDAWDPGNDLWIG
jgi:Tol biopolymer transport system component